MPEEEKWLLKMENIGKTFDLYLPEEMEPRERPNSTCGCMEQEIHWPEFTLPPINLRVLQPALDFYSDESDEWEEQEDE